MCDNARRMLDELMGRNRNSAMGETKNWHWQDEEFCPFYLVKFCPHELFVNTRADLGSCRKLHDDNAKAQYDEDSYNNCKRRYEDEFLRFCNNMINEVDRKIQKGKQRLMIMNKGSESASSANSQTSYISRCQDQINKLTERIKKLVAEAEEAGTRGDVDQAQDLMTTCDRLKVEREELVAKSGGQSGSDGNPHWSVELAQAQEKQMEVCEVCGAFLIVGDAQQRIEDHLTGKQHLGYLRLRKAVDEIYEKRRKDRQPRGGGGGEQSAANEPKKGRNHDDRQRSSSHRPPSSSDDDWDRRRRRRDERKGSSSSSYGGREEKGYGGGNDGRHHQRRDRNSDRSSRRGNGNEDNGRSRRDRSRSRSPM